MGDVFSSAFIFDDWSRGATITCAQQDPSFPASQLKRVQPRDRFQGAPGAIDLLIKAIRTDDRAMIGVGPLFMNVHNPHASVRIRASLLGHMISGYGPAIDTARIFGGTGPPHLYSLRFHQAGGKISLASSFDMTGSWLVESTVKVFLTAARHTIFKQISGGSFPDVFLDADRKLSFSYGGTTWSMTSSLAFDQYYAIAVAFSSSANELRFYVDGVKYLTVGGITGPKGLVSGTPGEAGSAGLEMSELRCWTTARIDASIFADALAPTTAPQSGLARYFKLDEGSNPSATVLIDATGGASGTRVGGLWVWPRRSWVSPALDGLDRTHHLWHDSLGATVGEVWVDVRDELSDEGFISMGNLVIGSGFQPSLNHSYGSAAFGFEGSGTRETTLDGVTHYVIGAPVGRVPLLFECDSEDELMQLWWRLSRLTAASRPVLFVADVADKYYMQMRMWWSLLVEGVVPVREAYRFSRLRTTLLELT